MQVNIWCLAGAATLLLFSCKQVAPGPGTTGSSIPAAVAVPYSEQEAEDGSTTGSVSAASNALYSAGAEASGRRYVTLAPGQSVSWTAPACDSLVVRFSYPNAAGGGGQGGSLDVLVDGSAAGTLAVTSRYTWVYGNPAWGSSNVWSSDPSQLKARHFWDETNLRLSSPVAAGSTVAVRNPTGSGQTVLIDLIDFETVPSAVAGPSGSVSFASYSPDSTGSADVTAKLNSALSAAAAQGKTLYVPEGTYRIGSVTLGAVTVQGAGMWRTRFVSASSGQGAQFRFGGGTATVSDLALFGNTNVRNDLSDSGNGLAGTPASGSTVRRVWIEHMKCAWWFGTWQNSAGPTGIRITQCRFRDTMADGVNLCSGTTDTTVDNCQVRGTGDDGLAAWSPTAGGPAGGSNTFAHNLVQSPWVASGIALYGGGPFEVAGNTVKDTVTSGSGLYVSANFGAYAFTGTVELKDNVLVRCGALESDPGGPTGAIRVLAGDTDMTAATFLFTDNTVTAPLESAFSIQGPHRVTKLTVQGLDAPDAAVLVHVRPDAQGSATFSGTTGSGSWVNDAGSSFSVAHQ
jgi:hypothetical protein